MRFTSFYAAGGVCTPSRASLMTGCYPRRVGLHLTDPDGIVLTPVSHNGLNPDEVTIAEVLRTRGYRKTRNVHDSHPAIVGRLTKLAETARADLADTNRPGRQRPPGRIGAPAQRVLQD